MINKNLQMKEDVKALQRKIKLVESKIVKDSKYVHTLGLITLYDMSLYDIDKLIESYEQFAAEQTTFLEGADLQSETEKNETNEVRQS